MVRGVASCRCLHTLSLPWWTWLATMRMEYCLDVLLCVQKFVTHRHTNQTAACTWCWTHTPLRLTLHTS